MHNFAKNPGTEKGRDTQFPWPSVCHGGTHTAELTWGQMGLLSFLTAVGDVGIQGRGTRFCWLCSRKFARTFTSRPTLTKPRRADKATGTYFCQGLLTIYEGQLSLWCK